MNEKEIRMMCDAFVRRLSDKESVSLVVEGNSMSPVINPGQSVKIEKCDVYSLNVGDIILYRKFEDHYTIHRIVDVIKTKEIIKYKTKGDNNYEQDDYYVEPGCIIGISVI